MGWFPLGFGEPFYPWYRHGGNYIRNVNISNTYMHNTNIINNGRINNYNYAYAHNPRAVTATTRNSFVNGQPVNRGEAHLTAASLRGAQVNTKFSVSPTRGSYFGSANAGNRVATPPAAIINRPVVARTTPAAAASHLPVRAVNTNALVPGRATGNVNANRPVNGSANTRGSVYANSSQAGRSPAAQSQSMPQSGRQRALALNRPPWAGSNNAASPRSGNSPNYNGRPSMNNRTTIPNGNRSYAPPQRSAPNYNNNRPSAPNGNRTYAPPQRSAPSHDNNRGYSAPRSSSPPRSYSPPARSQSAPSRSYSAPSRSYSAPSRSYSAPSHGSSAPSHSSGSGGGGGSRGGEASHGHH